MANMPYFGNLNRTVNKSKNYAGYSPNWETNLVNNNSKLNWGNGNNNLNSMRSVSPPTNSIQNWGSSNNVPNIQGQPFNNQQIDFSQLSYGEGQPLSYGAAGSAVDVNGLESTSAFDPKSGMDTELGWNNGNNTGEMSNWGKAGIAMQGAGILGNLYFGAKGLDLAEDQLASSDKAAGLNVNNQVAALEDTVRDRARTRYLQQHGTGSAADAAEAESRGAAAVSATGLKRWT